MNINQEIEQLTEEKNLLLEDINKIKDQLQYARADQLETGEYADPSWFARASSALRHKQRDYIILQEKIASKRKERKVYNGSRIESMFVNKARDILDKDTFCMIMDSAKFELEESGALL